jgi:hypothetical protein
VSLLSDIFLQGLRYTMRTFIQDSRCPCRDSNQALLKYKSRAWPLDQSVWLPANTTQFFDIYNIQWEKVNILGGHSIGHSKQKSIYIFIIGYPIPLRCWLLRIVATIANCFLEEGFCQKSFGTSSEHLQWFFVSHLANTCSLILTSDHSDWLLRWVWNMWTSTAVW